MPATKRKWISVVIVGLVSAPGPGQDIVTLAKSADVVLVGDVASTSPYQTKVLSRDGAAMSTPISAVIATVSPCLVIKGSAPASISVLGQPPDPLLAGFAPVSADGGVLRPKDRALLFLVRATSLSDASRWGVAYERDERTFLQAPSADCYGLADTVGRYWTLCVPIPKAVAMPKTQGTELETLAVVLAQAAVQATDSRQRWDDLGLLRDIGLYSRTDTGPGLTDTFVKWVRDNISPLITGWLASRVAADQAGALEALWELGDDTVTDAYLAALQKAGTDATDAVEMLTLEPLQQIAVGTGGVGKLLSLFNTKSSKLKRCALQALRPMAGKGSLRVPEVRAAAKKCLSDGDKELVLWAIWLLVDYDGDYQHGPAAYGMKAGKVPDECVQYWLNKQ